VGGTNLIVDVPVKAKKPTLPATTLMTHLFSDEEMREGNSSELIHDARKYLEYWHLLKRKYMQAC